LPRFIAPDVVFDTNVPLATGTAQVFDIIEMLYRFRSEHSQRAAERRALAQLLTATRENTASRRGFVVCAGPLVPAGNPGPVV